MVRKTIERRKMNARGGNGEVIFHDVVTTEELRGHGRLYSKITLRQGCSIGWHQHVTDTEPYYILKGRGIFTDNDGSRIEVGPGDVCYIELGESHSIENPFEEDLELMALIYNA